MVVDVIRQWSVLNLKESSAPGNHLDTYSSTEDFYRLELSRLSTTVPDYSSNYTFSVIIFLGEINV